MPQMARFVALVFAVPGNSFVLPRLQTIRAYASTLESAPAAAANAGIATSSDEALGALEEQGFIVDSTPGLNEDDRFDQTIFIRRFF